MSTNFTTQMLADLDAAIAQGALKVKYDDKEVEYRSINEMIRVRNLMRVELGIDSPKIQRVLPSFSKGSSCT